MADLRHQALILAVVCAGFAPARPAMAQDTAPDDWTTRKCELYAAAWQQVLDSHDLHDVRPGFVSGHQDFIDGGCDAGITVCPATQAEIALADLLLVLSMNEGMASTFVPFACPD